MNFAEAINSAGGVIVGDDGKPNVNTPEATEGPRHAGRLVQGQASSRRARSPGRKRTAAAPSSTGELIFHRNWGYVYNLADKTDGSSKVAGKFADCAAAGHHRSARRLQPGRSQPAVSPRTLRTRAPRSTSSSSCRRRENQKANALATSSCAGPGGALQRPGPGEGVPDVSDPAEVDPGRRAAARRPSTTVTSRWPSRTRRTRRCSSRFRPIRPCSSCRPSWRL